ncbi:MAG: cysteine desulfurase [Abitibacteriaceae bacterium]|nr:cysteine desulfurase [Abditibacteriaceae bacterium]
MPGEIQNRTQVYLDNAATTPLCAAAQAAMEPYLVGTFGNASSPYAVSRNARAAVDRARGQVAALIGAQPDEIVFTSGGTESDNWALLGTALANWERRGHILVSAVEHHAILEPAETLRDLGFEVESIGVDENGQVAPEAIEHLLRPNTILVSVMAVNNEVGVCQPVAEIGALLRERGITFHTDAVQAAGKLSVSVNELNVDLLSLSAHKFQGPKGVGALFIRRGVKMRAWQRGGAQERGRRAGTENVPGIVGMGVAAEIAHRNLSQNQTYLNSLRERLEQGLKSLPGACINGSSAPRAPHITNVSLAGQRAESLALNLDLMGFAVGTGSACASGALEPSHVLTAMGRSQSAARASLRVSLGVQNTVSDIDNFLDAVKQVLQRN